MLHLLFVFYDDAVVNLGLKLQIPGFEYPDDLGGNFQRAKLAKTSSPTNQQ
jgi:hypothetical protein